MQAQHCISHSVRGLHDNIVQMLYAADLAPPFYINLRARGRTSYVSHASADIEWVTIRSMTNEQFTVMRA